MLSTNLPGLSCYTLLQYAGALRLPQDCQRIDRFILHTVRMGYLPPEQPDAESLVTDAENRLLTSVNHRHYHVLGPLLPPVITRRPGLRPRPA